MCIRTSLTTLRSGFWDLALASHLGGSTDPLTAKAFLMEKSEGPGTYAHRKPLFLCSQYSGILCPSNREHSFRGLLGPGIGWLVCFLVCRLGPDRVECEAEGRQRWDGEPGNFHWSSYTGAWNVEGGSLTSASGSHCLQATWPFCSFFSFKNLYKDSYVMDFKGPIRLLYKHNYL